MPNLAGRLARTFGHVNGYAEAVEGAVFMAGMVSLGFVEKNPRAIVRKAACLIHPSSPYRQYLDQVIASTERGKTFEDVVAEVEDRWHLEYPATNNAVANGGIVAACLWFAGAVVFKGRMWIIGGTEDYYFGDDNSLKTDVWSSADGKEWKRETAAAPWSPRAYHAALVHDGKMWIFGGGNYVPRYQALHDVWCSADGVRRMGCRSHQKFRLCSAISRTSTS